MSSAGKHWKVPYKPRPRKPISERFWKLVDKTTTPNGCWPWIGNRDHENYGRLKIYLEPLNGKPRKRLLRAHRLSYELNNGPIPEGRVVCHKCDNPPCVRPDHLWLGTLADNINDARKKDRAFRKLTDENVKEIRRRYTGKWGEQSKLGREFGVTPTHIRNVAEKMCWKED